MTQIKVFIGYSRTDNDYLQALKKHLAPLERAKKIQVWYDGDLSPGDEWDADIKHNLATADLILLLISADALASDYFHDIEMEKALQRDKQKKAIVVPIIVRPCAWDDTPIHRLQALPQDGKAVLLWQHHDEAYDNIVKGIKAAIENLLKTRETKVQLATLKASILQLLEQNNLVQAQQALQKAHALKLPDPELDELQTAWQKLEDKRLEQERLEQEQQKQAHIANLPQPINQLINDLVAVEGGTFMMGGNEYSNEKPIHEVTLSSFYIGKYQVTLAQFKAFIEDSRYKTDAEKKTDGYGSYVYEGNSWKKKDGIDWRHNVEGKLQTNDQHPVIHVSWNDATEYCKWLSRKTGKNYTLPTEAEWEYAARGGNKSKGFTYAGSNNIDEVAWYDKNSGNKTQPVGQKLPNELGIYDMSGNVWEWCQDWYDENYYKNSPANNPTGPSTSSYRVLRGGSWSSDAVYCRVANRFNRTPATRDFIVGFRVVFVP